MGHAVLRGAYVMAEEDYISRVETEEKPRTEARVNWVANATLLWRHRQTLVRTAAIAMLLSAVVAFLIMPKEYQSVARLMPPDQGSSSGALLAALAGRSLGGLGGLGGLAGNLLGVRTSSALFMDMLRSRTVSDRLIDRFDLQHVYGKRYRIDTVKYIAKHTAIVEDKKSGVITLTFTDTDPNRARVIAQGYLDELNNVLTASNISSAHRERVFIEKRLVSVQEELQSAQKALSEFSSSNTTLDIKEQTHAMVDVAAKVQGELIVAQSQLESLEQIYGAENVRVRAAKARIAGLQHEVEKLNGSSADPALATATGSSGGKEDYPSLRQLPRLAVPYANLYRRVRIQETVYELLSQQYEMARIEEAKDTPVVNVLDAPLVPEKKSFPPRLIVVQVLTLLTVLAMSAYILARNLWRDVSAADPRKQLVEEVATTVRGRLRRVAWRRGAVQ